MNRAIIILSIPILLLVGGFIFYQSNTRSAPSNVTTVAPTEKPTTDSEQPTKTTSLENADFKMYNGQYVTYKYPGSWNPKKEESFGGGILESVNLGIPGVTSDQMLGFSSIDAANSRPNDIVSEESITISGSDGYKWIRKGVNYVSYDYVIPYKDENSFSIHVTVAKENQTLEKELDQLAESVILK
jgi:hypothetical protein